MLQYAFLTKNVFFKFKDDCYLKVHIFSNPTKHINIYDARFLSINQSGNFVGLHPLRISEVLVKTKD